MVSVIDDICDVLRVGVLEFIHPRAPFLVWHSDIDLVDEVVDYLEILGCRGDHQRVQTCIGDNVDFALDTESGLAAWFAFAPGPPGSVPVCPGTSSLKKVL